MNLKSANVIVSADGRIKLLDFSLARHVKSDENRLVFLRWEPRLDPVRDTDRFRALVRRTAFPAAGASRSSRGRSPVDRRGPI